MSKEKNKTQTRKILVGEQKNKGKKARKGGRRQKRRKEDILFNENRH